MKEVVKLIEKHVNERQIDRHQGLNALLDFLIGIFDVKHWQTPDGWMKEVRRAEKEEPYLYKIMMIWMDKVATAMEKGSWLDFFGGIYEEMYQSRGKSSTLGQFFTPPAVCDALALCCDERGEGVETINDCACGSGRLLLARACKNKWNRNDYITADDIDMASVKMCALNLMIHGCRGKVMQHDTLINPILYDYGFRINDIRYPIPSPFYSLTRIHLTKEDIEKQNERVRKKYGENVKVTKYVGYEVVKPLEGAKPIIKPVFTNPPIKEVKQEEVKEEYKGYTQLSLFD